jgi:uncharacterized protein YaiL (DUF2058 family)
MLQLLSMISLFTQRIILLENSVTSGLNSVFTPYFLINLKTVIMATSLQDQLLNSGLAKKESLQTTTTTKKNAPTKSYSSQAKSTTKKQSARSKPSTKQNNNDMPSLASLYKKRNKFERNQREEEVRKRKEAKQLRRLHYQKLSAIITPNTLNITDAEIQYNFVIGNNIKYIYVSDEQQKALIAGELAITFLGGKHCLIPASIIAAIREVEPEKLIVLATEADTEKADEK